MEGRLMRLLMRMIIQCLFDVQIVTHEILLNIFDSITNKISSKGCYYFIADRDATMHDVVRRVIGVSIINSDGVH